MLENEVHPPSLKTLRKLSACLGQPIHYLGGYDKLPEGTFGERLKKARLYHGLTKEEAAQKLRIDPKTITSWETDRVEPSSEHPSKVDLFLRINR